MYKLSCLQSGVQLLALACIIVSTIDRNAVEADEVPSFFLKIAKNIPRVGRSDGLTQYQLRSFPPLQNRPKNIPRIGKRDLHSRLSESIRSYLNEDEGSRGQYKRMINVQAPGDLESTAWEHFPLAIEGPPELWRTLASYTNDKYGTSSDDIDNEIWQRKKRREGEQTLQ